MHTFTFPFAVTVRQYTITGRVHVRFLLCVCTFSAFQHPACTDTELLSCLHGLLISLSQKSISSYFFSMRNNVLLLFELLFLQSHLLPCLQQMQRMMGMVRKEQRLSMSCSRLLSRWVLILSPCHCWGGWGLVGVLMALVLFFLLA